MNIKRNNTMFLLVQIIAIMIGVVGVTFAVSYVMNGINVNVDTANLAVDYTGTLTLPGTNLVPIPDSEVEGNSQHVMRINFTVKGVSSNPNIPIIYDVVLADLDNLDPAFRSEYVKWELEKNGTVISRGNLSYKFDTIENGRLILTDIQQDLKKSTETADSYEFRLWISESCPDGTVCTEEHDQSDLLGKTLSGKIAINLYTNSKKARLRGRTPEQMIEHLGLTSLVKTGTPTFANVATTDEGIYTAEDDLGTSYYFRGASQNNYVYFAEHYWRIVRINGDGTIRMIYDGTTKHENGESSTDRQIQTTAYNASSTGLESDNAGVGYMYGAANQSTYEATHANTNPSTIKGVLDTWYANNIDNTDYEQYVADAIYCNDRQVGSSGNGIGTTATDYAAYDRLIASTPSPTLKCSQPNDRFTQSTELGNGALATTYPIGLITADEVAMAGGRYGSYTNNQYYLYTGQSYRTMSPYLFDDFFDVAGVWSVNSSGDLSSVRVGYSNGARPIVSLKSYVMLDGDGSYETPFYIVDSNQTAAEYLTALYNTGTATQEVTANNVTYEYRKDISMMKDIGGNIRYYGPNPDNYVMFNGEQWRIIGVFNNIDDGTGKKETRVKIARATPLSTNYAWDSSTGVNDWTNASLNMYLNGDYLSSITTLNLIGNAIWDIRGTIDSVSLYANDCYNIERTTGSAPPGTTEVQWPGKIALMYPSDYMYAGDLMACAKDGGNWDTDTTNCRDKSWLRSSSSVQWTLMPNIGVSIFSFNVSTDGSIAWDSVSLTHAVRPVLFLNSNIAIVDGTGKPGDEFILG